jgi:hypothetical protein
MVRLLVVLTLLLSGCALRAPAAGPRAPAGSAAPPVDAADALAALAGLPVKGRAPMTGYDRAAFGPAWSDDTDDQWGHNGCDTRNDVLRRDLAEVTLKPGTRGCVVLTGTLRDPYGDATLRFVRAAPPPASPSRSTTWWRWVMPGRPARGAGARPDGRRSPTTRASCWPSTAGSTRPSATATRPRGCRRTGRDGVPTSRDR